MVVPPEGEVIGWKRCRRGAIVKLLIPADAARSNATGRKCRASKVIVLDVIGAEMGVSLHDPGLIYRKGKIVLPDSWCDDRWQECAGGIHFYITREEAEAHV